MYNGYFTLDNIAADKLYSGKLNPEEYQMPLNSYILVRNEDDEIVDSYITTEFGLEKVKHGIIRNNYDTIKARNPYQVLAMDLLNKREIPVKIIRGVYGSGKDYLMLNKALSLIDSGEFSKIIYIRPNVTLAGVPEIGHLKGDLNDKLGWTLGPLYDKVGGEDGVEKLIMDNKLEMVPLLFIRGRSFDNSIIYVSEGQNITSEIAKVLISRIGSNSELWINADTHQTDKRMFEEDNGIVKMIDRLTGNPLFGYVYLPITERSKVAELATLLD